MTMKVTLSEFMGCEDWSKAELRKAIDDLGNKLLEREKLIRDMYEFGAGDWRYTPLMRTKHDDMRKEVTKRLRELGIEVE